MPRLISGLTIGGFRRMCGNWRTRTSSCCRRIPAIHRSSSRRSANTARFKSACATGRLPSRARKGWCGFGSVATPTMTGSWARIVPNDECYEDQGGEREADRVALSLSMVCYHLPYQLPLVFGDACFCAPGLGSFYCSVLRRRDFEVFADRSGHRVLYLRMPGHGGELVVRAVNVD